MIFYFMHCDFCALGLGCRLSSHLFAIVQTQKRVTHMNHLSSRAERSSRADWRVITRDSILWQSAINESMSIKWKLTRIKSLHRYSIRESSNLKRPNEQQQYISDNFEDKRAFFTISYIKYIVNRNNACYCFISKVCDLFAEVFFLFCISFVTRLQKY